MIVPFYDFKSLHNHTFQQQAKERISKILEDNSFVEGEFNTKFEEDFSSMQKNSHCLLVANGTDALEISLKASDIKEGDLVSSLESHFLQQLKQLLTLVLSQSLSMFRLQLDLCARNPFQDVPQTTI